MRIKLIHLSLFLAASVIITSGYSLVVFWNLISRKDAPFIIKMQESAGTIESVAYIPAGFRQPPLTCISTPSGTFVINEHISVPKGIEAFVTNASHLTWEGASFHYFIH